MERGDDPQWRQSRAAERQTAAGYLWQKHTYIQMSLEREDVVWFEVSGFRLPRVKLSTCRKSFHTAILETASSVRGTTIVVRAVKYVPYSVRCCLLVVRVATINKWVVEYYLQ